MWDRLEGACSVDTHPGSGGHAAGLQLREFLCGCLDGVSRTQEFSLGNDRGVTGIHPVHSCMNTQHILLLIGWYIVDVISRGVTCNYENKAKQNKISQTFRFNVDN